MSIPQRDDLSPEEIQDLIIDATENKIVHVSEIVPGAIHDFTLLENGEEIPPETQAIADLGYQRIKNIHEKSEISHKKPKNRKLTEEEKDFNKILSKVRVIIENILGDIKVFRIMSDRYRNKMIRFNIKFRVIAGIVNMKNRFA